MRPIFWFIGAVIWAKQEAPARTRWVYIAHQDLFPLNKAIMAQLGNVKSHKLEPSQWHHSTFACHMMQIECCQRWQRCINSEFCFPIPDLSHVLNSCSLGNQFCCTANRTGEAVRYVMDTTHFGWLLCFGLSEQTNWCISCRWQVTTGVGGKEATGWGEPVQILQQPFTHRHF